MINIFSRGLDRVISLIPGTNLDTFFSEDFSSPHCQITLCLDSPNPYSKGLEMLTIKNLAEGLGHNWHTLSLDFSSFP